MQQAMNTYALTLAALVCLVVEVVILIALYAYNGTWLAAMFYSVMVFGPISVVIGPPLYRYIDRASD
jgi:hypothetical protein